jgi:hypothetical protein
MRATTGLVLSLALLIAGCAARQAPPSSNAPASPATPLRFEAPTNVSAPCPRCYEPAIGSDARGHLFVAAHRLGGVGVSTDQGRTWTKTPAIPKPSSPMSPDGDPGDDVVQVAPWGMVYYTRLWSDGGGAAGAGVQVLSSDNEGQSWRTNVFIHARNGPAPSVVSDRQWLAFDGDQSVFLLYNCAASALICLTRSDDRGATFGQTIVVVTPADHTFPSPEGMPFVDADHVLVVPYYADPRSDGSVGARTIAVAISRDGGRSFTQSKVFTHPPAKGTSGGAWPEATFLANRSWAASWSAAGAVYAAFSKDQGRSWSPPTILSASESGDAGGAPWLNGGLNNAKTDVLDAVYNTRGPGVHLARFHPDGTHEIAAVPVVGGGQGDYPYFTHLPDGRVAAVFLTPEGNLQVSITNR